MALQSFELTEVTVDSIQGILNSLPGEGTYQLYANGVILLVHKDDNARDLMDAYEDQLAMKQS